MEIKGPNHIMTFGKNKSETLATIYKYQPSYIEFLIENIEDFKIDLCQFESLPKPTPSYYNPGAFTNEPDLGSKGITEISMDELFKSVMNSDQINPLVKVSDIKGDNLNQLTISFQKGLEN